MCAQVESFRRQGRHHLQRPPATGTGPTTLGGVAACGKSEISWRTLCKELKTDAVSAHPFAKNRNSIQVPRNRPDGITIRYRRPSREHQVDRRHLCNPHLNQVANLPKVLREHPGPPAIRCRTRLTRPHSTTAPPALVVYREAPTEKLSYLHLIRRSHGPAPAVHRPGRSGPPRWPLRQ